MVPPEGDLEELARVEVASGLVPYPMMAQDILVLVPVSWCSFEVAFLARCSFEGAFLA